MTRFLCPLLVGLLAAEAARAQGIRGVTRRTPTLEFQAPARQFFDAAGLQVSGGTAPATGPSAAGVARPVPMPPRSNRAAAGAVQPRPYVLGPMKPGAGTQAARPPVRPRPMPAPPQPAAARRQEDR